MNTQAIERHYPFAGISWKLSEFACYAAINGIVHFLCSKNGNALPANMVIFIQDVIALGLLLMFVGPKAVQPKKHLHLHLLRGGVSVLGVIAWYYALRVMPIAEAVALGFMGPIIGTIGASVFLKEQITYKRIAALLLSLLVVWCLVHPGSVFISNQDNLKGVGCVALSSFCFAVATILTRKLANIGYTPQLLTRYLLWSMVPVTLILAGLDWQTPELSHWPWLILNGVLTAMALYCLSSSLFYAELSFLAPLDLARFIFNVLVGYLAFTELPSLDAMVIVFVLVCFTSLRKIFNLK
jgi:drug/metabolite transporter (DMT)-like permease